MTGSPYGGENPDRPDPFAPVDYPADMGLPPPVQSSAGYQPPEYPPTYPGYYAPPAYGYGYDPYRPLRPPGTNGKAIAALVCSLVGVFCCGVTCIPGVILGGLAMRETRRTGQDGFGIALAGTIIGGLAVAGFLVYLVIYVGLFASGWQWA